MRNGVHRLGQPFGRHQRRVCCPALKMAMTPSLSMKTKMVALVTTLTG